MRADEYPWWVAIIATLAIGYVGYKFNRIVDFAGGSIINRWKRRRAAGRIKRLSFGLIGEVAYLNQIHAARILPFIFLSGMLWATSALSALSMWQSGRISGSTLDFAQSGFFYILALASTFFIGITHAEYRRALSYGRSPMRMIEEEKRQILRLDPDADVSKLEHIEVIARGIEIDQAEEIRRLIRLALSDEPQNGQSPAISAEISAKEE